MAKHSTSCAAEIKQAQLKELPLKQEFALANAGYKIGHRDPNVKPEHTGKFMITDSEDDEDGYAIVGDDRAELIAEAYAHLFECARPAESQRGQEARKMPETQNTDRRPIAGDPRLFIEKLGYDIDTDCDQPGLWIWTASSDGCDSSFHTAMEALDGAWNDALAQTLAISEISCEEWGQMDFDQQRVAITFALSGELPSLSDLSPDTQMEWVARVREVYPDIGPKEAFRYADQDFIENEGVLPKPAVAETQKG